VSKLREVFEYPTGVTREVLGVRVTPTQDTVRRFSGSDIDDANQRNDPNNWKDTYVSVRGGLEFQVRRRDGSWTDPAFNTVTSCASGPAVVLYDPVKDVVGVIEEFRLPIFFRDIADVRKGILLNRPAGHVMALTMGAKKADETMEAAAMREILEETGCSTGRLCKCPEIPSQQSISTDTLGFYIAEFDSSKARQGAETGVKAEGELITFHMMPAATFFARAMRGDFDTVGVTGAFFLLNLREEIRAAWAPELIGGPRGSNAPTRIVGPAA
jgi:8-oxo-dGTP pyrophosphatase MutT (NUDIX family)